MPVLKELLETVPQTGRVEWIGIASERRGTVEPQQEITVELNTGIAGEHHATSGRSQRQVTLIQQEHLSVIASMMGKDSVDPKLLRRNIVVSGVNLLSFKVARFQVGEVILEGTGPCAPCSLMEDNLGPGGYSAMRGHGGITTVVVQAGKIRVGDEVKFLELVSVEEKPV